MNKRKLLLLLFGSIALSASAADAVTTTTPAAGGFTFNWQAMIPVLIPVLLALYKQWLPSAPTWLLPIVAPALGAIADIAAQVAGWNTLGVGWSALLGSAGVGIREAYDQTKRKLPAAGVGLFVLFCFLGAIAVGLTSCKGPQLESGGAYNPANPDGTVQAAPETELFIIDSAYKVAYDMIDVAFEFERNNRRALYNLSPKIKREMDKLREEAYVVHLDYLQCRKLYLANKTPANLDQLSEVLSKLQRASAVAQEVIAKKGEPTTE